MPQNLYLQLCFEAQIFSTMKNSLEVSSKTKLEVKKYSWIFNINVSFFLGSQVVKFNVQTVQLPDLTPRKNWLKAVDIMGKRQDSGQSQHVKNIRSFYEQVTHKVIRGSYYQIQRISKAKFSNCTCQKLFFALTTGSNLTN